MQRKVDDLVSAITELESKVMAALDKGEEGLANEVAEGISQLESQPKE
ncbi:MULTISPECIES: hypothetical protein [Halomonadaceae]|nr:hypothetical protein [Halomonas sp. 3F2F]